ncbi:glycoside hydrolase family 2 [bacterium]|nr:MAG: glycoside hydrolase family 2 [bacterium]
MHRLPVRILCVIFFLYSITAAAEWKPADGPLKTRWSRDVGPNRVLPDYPRPQMVRHDWMNLNGLWQFDTTAADAAVPEGKTLAGEILVPFPIESSLSGVMKPADHIWYRRTFKIPSYWMNRRMLLHFGAVDWETTVYVNGEAFGPHTGGYDGFTFDITNALKPDGEQELIVKVVDPTDSGAQPVGKQVRHPQGIFYTSTTGIWQTVWLEPVDSLHITTLRMTPDIDNALLHVAVEAAQPGQVKVTVLDGRRVAGEARGEAGKGISDPIPVPKLWTPEDPFLYTINITLSTDGKQRDVVTSYAGMRKVSLGKDAKGRGTILLNDKQVFLLGPLDQGFWPDGLYRAPTDKALKYDIEMEKKLGFNMVRKHVKVEPERWYYWCDKLGLLVWQDMPSPNPDNFKNARTPESDRQFEIELERMVKGLYNHPSIMMWVVFNEGWGQFDTERLTKKVKDMDPSRLVNNASGWADFKVGDVADIHSYPGPESPSPETQRAAVLGEFGGLGLPLPPHTWTAARNWGYQNLKTTEDLGLRYAELLEGVHQLAADSGLCAAVYTQTTDVETEVNGLMTYDREVTKLNPSLASAVNHDKLPSPPRVLTPYRLFIDTTSIPLVTRKHEEIRYTIDGSEPGRGSILYQNPIKLAKTTALKAKSFGDRGQSSRVVEATFTRTEPHPAAPGGKSLTRGVQYRYYEGTWRMLPDFAALTPKSSGTTDSLVIGRIKASEDHFGIVYNGYLRIPRDGVYRFFLLSDDGSRLVIDRDTVVNNDGTHWPTEKRGEIALKAGDHPFTLSYFEDFLGDVLELSYEGPGIARQPISPDQLFHE